MEKKWIIALLVIISNTSHSQIHKSILDIDHSKIQYAGNIGFISAGVGYLAVEEKAEIDIMMGYLPKSIGGVRITTLSIKGAYNPWKIRLSNTMNYQPFYIGAYLSYSLGSDFYFSLPEQYPRGYYWWPTSLRAGLFIGGRIHKDISLQPIEGIGFYYEVGSYDLKLVSVMSNLGYFSVLDVLDLALGIKIKF